MSHAAGQADARKKRPWWQWMLGGLLALVVLSAIFGDDESGKTVTETTTVTVTQPPPSQTTTTLAEAVETLADAEQAADDDQYGQAVAIASLLGSDEETSVRSRIANRVARRALAAVRAGDRGRAKRLLAQADRYPTTALTRQARSSYRTATARAAERARTVLVAAATRRQAAAQRRREEQAAIEVEPESAGNCDSNYSGCVPAYPPDVNCPQVNGPVEVLGSDPHGLDRDGDGIACES
jgi:hypothetical protein